MGGAPRNPARDLSRDFRGTPRTLRVHVHTYVYTHIPIHMCVYTYIYIYMCIHMLVNKTHEQTTDPP